MTCQLYLFILKSYMPQPHLLCHRYELFFVSSHCYYNLISLVPTRLSISTSFFWSRSPTRRMWVKQAVCFNPRLTREDYLQANAFPNLVVVKQEEYPHTLQRKATGRRAMSKVVRRRLTRCCQAWLLECQHRLLPGRPGGRFTSQCLTVTM